jgi:hypothetical protein
MAKQIRFEYEGVPYTLEYTRKSIEMMEKQGFVASEIAEKPLSTLPALFAGAFYAHHRFVKRDTIDAIFSKLSDKEGLIAKLAEMYNEPIEALFDEPKEGNVKWEASW